MIRRNTHRKGFSLIEVLVAIFVFATGILGFAALQMKSLAMLSNSNSTSMAMLAANDMADRMRANPVAVFDGAYDDIAQTLSDQVADPNCGADCTPSQLAQYDAHSVFQQIVGELVSPTLAVTNVGDSIFSITVTWEERIGENIEAQKQHRISFLPYKP